MKVDFQIALKAKGKKWSLVRGLRYCWVLMLFVSVTAPRPFFSLNLMPGFKELLHFIRDN